MKSSSVVGDIATRYADPSLAREELGWVAEKNLDDMCADSWRWQKNNPEVIHRIKYCTFSFP